MRVYRVNPEPNDERSVSIGNRSEKDAAMLNLQDELVAWTLFDQRLKNAELRQFLSSAASSTGIGTSLERFAGRVLSGFGQRLQSSVDRRTSARRWLLAADLCPKCEQ